jgi:septum formation protein
MTRRQQPRVILASQSPRRRQLLSLVGIAHEVKPADIDERYLAGEDPRAHAERLAREKVAAITDADAVVIAADTIVVVDGDVLGKPKDEQDAARMLRRLGGRTHKVMTAVAVEWRGRVESGVEEVDVTFHPLSDVAIADYIATREPMDKAGAYAVQGLASRFITRVEGSYSNVVGLPIALVYQMLTTKLLTF